MTLFNKDVFNWFQKLDQCAKDLVRREWLIALVGCSNVVKRESKKKR